LQDLSFDILNHINKIKMKKITATIDYNASNEGINNRRNMINTSSEYLFQEKRIEDPAIFNGNIENYIGITMIPTGIMGPVKVLGTAAHGDFYVPLATSEGALVASYHRGAKACYQAGGVTSICLTEGVQRSPVFKFHNLYDLGLFLVWISQKKGLFEVITSNSSRYAQLKEMKTSVEGNHLIVTFEYHTGDASGQNMVTFCTESICQYIIENCPTKPVLWFIEGNYSGDKKATTRSFLQVRGKKITSEIVLPKEIVEKTLKTTSQAMFDYWLTSTMGVIQSGAIGAQGHYANGLAAIFLATGQDAACVSESSVGITRMEVLPDGALYASVTLPNLIVGTVGGGTSLPTQKECLQIMDCYGQGKAVKFAEIIGAVLLAGELSIAAALSAGHFSNAHKQLGRKAV
jgi:hydroxymethylglutaryl-CoA reductase (NADPH)